MHRLTAMENALQGMPDLDWTRRCERIAASGYQAVYVTPYPLTADDLDRLQHIDQEPKKQGLSVSAVYANVDLALPPEHASSRLVHRLFEEVAGAPRIEVSFKCSEPRSMPDDVEDAVASRLEPLLGIAQRRDIDVAIYPHSFYPLETIGQANRVVRRLAHPRLSVVFPTSHVFAIRPAHAVVTELQSCAPIISSFNFCGCGRTAPVGQAKTVHLPLGEGELDLDPLWNVLESAGYSGDIIVQGHGWGANGLEWLKRSAAWVAQRRAVSRNSG